MGPASTAAAAPAAAPRWPALDGLRGLAVLAVMAYHLGHLEGGYLGVDLFFVLSGFLITSLLLREGSATGGVDLRHFWVRRARRLLPALAVALVGVVVAARIWLDHGTLPALRVDALTTAGYVANWRFATQTAGGYFAADPSPLRHTWSLAIEEQYYLVWPLVVVAGMVLARRRGARAAVVVGGTALAGAVASALWMALHAASWSTDRLYLGTDTRLVAPLSGAVLACLLQGRLDRRPSAGVRRGAGVVGAVALAGLAVAVVAVPPDAAWMYRGGFALVAVLGAAVVAGSVVGREGALARALGPRPLRWVGERSYGLYLYSWPLQVVLAAQGLAGAALAAATTAGAFAAATVSFRYLEVPVRRDGLRALLPRRRDADAPAPAASRRAPGALVAGAVLVVLVVVVAGTTTTARPDPLAALGAEELEAGARRPAVAPTGSGGEEGSRVLVVGDSVAYTLGEYAPTDIPGVASVDARGLPGCGLLTKGARPAEAVEAGSPEDYEGCATPVADADRLGLEGDPDVVLLVTGAWESSDHERDGRTVGPGDEGWTAEIRSLLDARVTELGAEGAVVALWADPCGPDAEERRRQAWFTEEVLDPVAASRDEAVVVRPAEVACAGDEPITDVAGVGDPRPDDGQHWSEDGARWLWQGWLGPTLHDLDTRDG
ncbi:acyltransferase family protein [Iamia majanohamensis]|uniref:Acyltransferase family protein n=1 Tax=Iamia majanohamensis TaxID=467976 RepID=A0AAE9YC82_9ACTN|nr:acyltransferase family protein [Iamia majanohamensis]WCO68503.1 acyltransferase family protein [Iamia majanohamensis]